MNRPPRLSTSSRPIVYEVDARSWLAGISRRERRMVRLGDVPEADLERILATGCDAVWLMGIWRTGPVGRRVARSRPEIIDRAQEILGAALSKANALGMAELSNRPAAT